MEKKHIIEKWQKWKDDNYMEIGVNNNSMIENIMSDYAKELEQEVFALNGTVEHYKSLFELTKGYLRISIPSMICPRNMNKKEWIEWCDKVEKLIHE